MKTYGEVDVQTPVMSTSVIIGGKWLVSASGRITPEE
jgi:hypothetical protein